MLETEQTEQIEQTAPRRLLSSIEAAVMLGVSESTVKNMFARGDLTRIKVYRRTLIDVREIEALIERLKEASHDN